MDLWTPQVNEKHFHPSFKTLRSLASKGALNVINSWTNGFTDRDNKFVKEFQTTFNSSFWELYLHASFKELGFKINFDHPAPDFMLQFGDDTINVEATIANNAEGYRPEFDKSNIWKIQDTDPYDSRQQTAIRIANAITCKSLKYQTKYNKLDHVKEHPFVLGVMPFDCPFTFSASQSAMRMVLFGMDEPILDVNINSSVGMKLDYSEISSITKFNSVGKSVEIPVGMFRDIRYSHISAVIFSNTATSRKVSALAGDLHEKAVLWSEDITRLKVDLNLKFIRFKNIMKHC